MAEFASYRSYHEFAESIRTRSRYGSDPEQGAFLRVLIETSVARQEVIPGSSKLWRARKGHGWRRVDDSGEEEEGPFDIPAPRDIDEMKPLRDRAHEGRANPKGIPFLYLATHQETAIAEVRPWVGLYVSVAQFALERDVRVLNCATDDHRLMAHSGEPEPEERERAVWQDIDQAFSQPVNSGDDTADYAPTQIIAEFVRVSGLDGIAYRSSLGSGHNVALFDMEMAKGVDCQLFRIRSVKFDWSMEGYP
jgi:RES domain-containing protein